MNSPNFDRILMTNDGLCDTLGLGCWGALLFQDVQRDNPTIDVEGHEDVLGVLVDGADVVEEAGEEPGFVAELPFWEVLSGDCKTWQYS